MNPDNNLEHLRHSLAHLLAAAVLELYPDAKPTIGPAVDNGFYYDFDFDAELTRNNTEQTQKSIGDKDLAQIEAKMKELLPSWEVFKEIEVSAEEAKNIFAGNPYKLELINEIAEKGEKITLYYSGPADSCSDKESLSTIHYPLSTGFLDLCRGGHVENPSKEINSKAFELSRIAGAYWRGDEKNTMLTRVYGLAFTTKDELQKYKTQVEEAKKRDHKKLGRELGLYMFHETAPGMPYWLPNGLIVYNELVNFWRKEHRKHGYKEIASPLVNKSDLWKISGHWDHYQEDMFIADMGENEVYGIKPMNCPNAMIVFQSMQISYKDLPLRLSDTDRLHRYERSGTLNGLLRCRSFQQDDSHNFISEDMIESEYEHIFELCKEFYGIFNLSYSFRLGTRPEKFLGEKSVWDKAESALRNILEKSGVTYTVAEGDGAFYGPKIDILMKDSLGRDWQMGTIQLDFQLPIRFGLDYTDRDGKKKMPVVIHRVIYGSLERFLGILVEHTAGEIPFWLSPVQVKILAVKDSHAKFAKEVYETLSAANIRVELDASDEGLGKKVRAAKVGKVPYWIVIGDKEIESKTLTVEHRSGTKESVPAQDIMGYFTSLQ